MRGRLFRIAVVLALTALAFAAWTPHPFLMAGLAMLATVVLLVVGASMAREAGTEIWLLQDPVPRRLWKAATGGIILRFGLAVTATGILIGAVALAWQTPGHPGALGVAAGKAMGLFLGLGVIAIGAFLALVSFIAAAVSGLLEERGRARSETDPGAGGPPSAPR